MGDAPLSQQVRELFWGTEGCSVAEGDTHTGPSLALKVDGGWMPTLGHIALLKHSMFFVFYTDIVNCDLKSTLRVLYNLFTKYRNVE